MDIPAPVNLSALQAILAKSKEVMKKVEGDKPVKTPSRTERISENYGDDYYNENDEREMVYENTQSTNDFQAPRDYTADMVRQSNLPQAIKDIMIAKPMPRLTAPPSKVSAEDISRMTGQPIRTAKEPIRENLQPRQNNSDMITVSKSELKEMINEGISTFFKQIYDKTLTEETIKKTINLLIKEGKITVKKKQ